MIFFALANPYFQGKSFMEGFNEIELSETRENLVAFRAEGKITSDQLEVFNQKIESIREQGHKALVYLDLSEYESFEPSMVLTKLKAMGTYFKGIEKLAYVVDNDIYIKIIGFMDILTPMHMKAFDEDDKVEAETWLFSDQT